MRQVKALLFDTFGTVVDWRSGVARESAPFLAKHGVAMDPVAFAVAWRKRYQPAMEAVRTGQRPFERLDVLHRENLEATLRDAGADPAAIPEADLAAWNRAWHRLDPWPDGIAGLARLKTRFIIAPLSNGNIALLLNMAKRAGIPWDTVLGSEVAQAFKPTPQAYLRTAEVLGLEPAECMMVAAHNRDLAAARRCGLMTGFVARPTEHGPGQTTDLAAEQDWEVVATDFMDMADKLGCPA
ncbi:haloacid dehalogenase type II [Falsiroseomonas sp.]|uniref:haloacid dehalogenase type II n=1 Tax=Falsiroseomonas sp. TaxID=2870721 RepID=UPI00356716F1